MGSRRVVASQVQNQFTQHHNSHGSGCYDCSAAKMITLCLSEQAFRVQSVHLLPLHYLILRTDVE